MQRTKFQWEVDLIDPETRDTETVIVAAYWSPEHELTEESVTDAARIQTWWRDLTKHNRKVKWVPLGPPRPLDAL